MLTQQVQARRRAAVDEVPRARLKITAMGEAGHRAIPAPQTI